VEQSRYRLVVNGELSDRYAAAFEGMDIGFADGKTVIEGPVRDQSELQGLLSRVSGLGLTLLSVMREDGPSGRTDMR
jgi:hypothetical protein